MYDDFETAFKCKIVKATKRGKLFASWQGKVYKFKHYRHRDRFFDYVDDIVRRRVAWYEHLERTKNKLYEQKES